MFLPWDSKGIQKLTLPINKNCLEDSQADYRGIF